MPKTAWLVSKVQHDYPDFRFCQADYDHWSARDNTVYYNPNQPDYEVYLLHELAHALLNHASFKKDIELISIERSAWQLAVSDLAPRYRITISPDLIDNALDSYREWIHTKSACPRCDQTGLQIDSRTYSCLNCQHQWRVNQGITRAIRRYHLL